MVRITQIACIRDVLDVVSSIVCPVSYTRLLHAGFDKVNVPRHVVILVEKEPCSED